MGNFLAVFATVDMENQFLLCEDVIFVEGTASLLLLGLLLEHGADLLFAIIIICVQIKNNIFFRKITIKATTCKMDSFFREYL